MSTHTLATTDLTAMVPGTETEDLARKTAIAQAVTEFIATVAIEYGNFDRPLFSTLINWLGPVAEELAVTAIHVPNRFEGEGMPAHEVIVLDSGDALFLYTTVFGVNQGRPLIICARPNFNDPKRLSVLHATESVFKVSLATPESPFLPNVPRWVRQAG